MIITTRFRDISYEEALKCLEIDERSDISWQQAARAKPLRIIVPAYTGPVQNPKCSGPFFMNADRYEVEVDPISSRATMARLRSRGGPA